MDELSCLSLSMCMSNGVECLWYDCTNKNIKNVFYVFMFVQMSSASPQKCRIVSVVIGIDRRE